MKFVTCSCNLPSVFRRILSGNERMSCEGARPSPRHPEIHAWIPGSRSWLRKFWACEPLHVPESSQWFVIRSPVSRAATSSAVPAVPVGWSSVTATVGAETASRLRGPALLRRAHTAPRASLKRTNRTYSSLSRQSSHQARQCHCAVRRGAWEQCSVSRVPASAQRRASAAN